MHLSLIDFEISGQLFRSNCFPSALLVTSRQVCTVGHSRTLLTEGLILHGICYILYIILYFSVMFLHMLVLQGMDLGYFISVKCFSFDESED